MYKGNFDQTVFDSFLTLTSSGEKYATIGTDSEGYNINTTGYYKRDIELNDWNALALCILYDFDANNWGGGKESGAYRARDVEQSLFNKKYHDSLKGYDEIKIQTEMNTLQLYACKLVQGVAEYIKSRMTQSTYAEYVQLALINFKELINTKIVIPKLNVRKVVKETYRTGIKKSITSTFLINVVKRYQLKF